MGLRKKSLEPLRNCAFCGGKPKLTKCGDQKEYWIYLCTSCYETPVRFWEASISPNKARDMWQQRTEEAEHVLLIYHWVKRVEALKAALAEEEKKNEV